VRHTGYLGRSGRDARVSECAYQVLLVDRRSHAYNYRYCTVAVIDTSKSSVLARR
jgi:hypothetical protein